MTRITMVQGDITEQQVDVVVNAANSSLLGGGGVDGAIHRKGGPAILADCRRLRDSHYGRGLDAGRAVVTTAGRLPARWVVHTVGPVYYPDLYEERAELLSSCYRESLRLAAELGARSVAFPAISTGVYRWPMEDAARIALTAVTEAVADPSVVAGTAPAEVRFVLFGADAFEVFDRVRQELGRPGAR
ncbi:O-acetyl-ADP-ribose deacetylase [Kitasatospora sp. NPDC048540]|uniref:O-acetyl-ADP-ribose deacetylase n=1 Tax=unclassified Kitasatospora TaxID=2633591 RepID=UPI00053B3BFC|nr:O-acetyl-ADP-ribose deacetylase [Kitasatospora sp. MBT63]